MDSILTSIKKLLGIEEGYEVFDADIIIYINSAISNLTQLGVGPKRGFSISDEKATWHDFLKTTKDKDRIESVKSYIYLKVKLLFDPPGGSSVLESYNRTIQELEWRLNVAVDPGEEETIVIEYESLDDGALNIIVQDVEVSKVNDVKVYTEPVVESLITESIQDYDSGILEAYY